jgi:hypothetical protein
MSDAARDRRAADRLPRPLGTPRSAAPLGALVWLAACAGADQAPGPIPNIEGYYTGTYSLAVESDRVTCPAALLIEDQADSVFRTTFEVLRTMGTGLSCTDTIETGSGVVRANGTATALAELVEPVTCTLKEANTGLTGPVTGGRITLSGRYTYRCPVEYTWTLRFSGSTAGAPLPAYPDRRGSYTGSWTTIVPGLQISCPVSVSLADQSRDDVTGSYTLQAAGSCLAQPAQLLQGVVTVDGDLSLSGTPPVPAGCTVQQALALAGTAGNGALSIAGGYVLLCGASQRAFTVVLTAMRP